MQGSILERLSLKHLVWCGDFGPENRSESCYHLVLVGTVARSKRTDLQNWPTHRLIRLEFGLLGKLLNVMPLFVRVWVGIWLVVRKPLVCVSMSLSHFVHVHVLLRSGFWESKFPSSHAYPQSFNVAQWTN